MKKEIIEILGKNHTTPVVFKSLGKGIYTWKNGVYVLKGGMDMEFDEFTESEQSDMLTELKAGNYVLDASYIGG